MRTGAGVATSTGTRRHHCSPSRCERPCRSRQQSGGYELFPGDPGRDRCTDGGLRGGDRRCESGTQPSGLRCYPGKLQCLASCRGHIRYHEPTLAAFPQRCSGERYGTAVRSQGAAVQQHAACRDRNRDDLRRVGCGLSERCDRRSAHLEFRTITGADPVRDVAGSEFRNRAARTLGDE